MLSHRVIPCLLVQDRDLVKTSRFARPVYVGDPLNAVRIFNDKEVDELIVLDIGASARGRGPDFAMVEELAEQCFMPLCYGGGIRSADDAFRLFALGVEKVCLQSAWLDDPIIVREITERMGTQSVVVSIDVKRDWRGRARAHSASDRRLETRDWRRLIAQAVTDGAGEIMLTAVDRDGTRSGMDFPLIAEASRIADVPLIAAGGVGSLADIRAAVDAGASAVAAGAFFVLYGPHRAVLITYPTQDELRALFG